MKELEKLMEELIEKLEDIEFNSHYEGCGLEDVNITDRYEAMEYGWNRCLEVVRESLNN